MMGSRKTVPPTIFLIVPLGERHIFFKPNSETLFSSGVIVAHLIPTLCFKIALAASTVTLSSERALVLKQNIYPCLPLCTPIVCPTKSGIIIDALDQVLITVFFPEA